MFMKGIRREMVGRSCHSVGFGGRAFNAKLGWQFDSQMKRADLRKGVKGLGGLEGTHSEQNPHPPTLAGRKLGPWKRAGIKIPRRTQQGSVDDCQLRVTFKAFLYSPHKQLWSLTKHTSRRGLSVPLGSPVISYPSSSFGKDLSVSCCFFSP